MESPPQEEKQAEGQDEHDDGHLPMPSPWTFALAVLVLLAFGVVIGTTGHRRQRPQTLVLAGTASSGGQVLTAASSPPLPIETPSPKPESHTQIQAEPSAPGQSASEPGTQSEIEPPKSKGKPASKHSHSSKQSTGHKSGVENSGPKSRLPPIKHVFLIVLADQGFDSAFGTNSSAHYLAVTLRAQGELIDNYYALAGGELANEIALISGQGPTQQTAENCPLYQSLTPGGSGREGQTIGSGCVYPPQTLTLANQLASSELGWRAYIEGMAGGQPSIATACRHPPLGSADPDHTTGTYVTWRNPFVYFASLTEQPSCGEDDLDLSKLPSQLKATATAPAFSYIAPDPCDDGSEEPCAPQSPAGLGPADEFLEKIVPEIERSSAYREGGLIAITSDQALQSGTEADSSGCCLSVKYPNLPAATPSVGTTDAGGGKVGMLLISKYVKPGSTEVTGQYNHYSFLLTLEELFKLKPLGYSSAPSLLAFEHSVFNAYK